MKRYRKRKGEKGKKKWNNSCQSNHLTTTATPPPKLYHQWLMQSSLPALSYAPNQPPQTMASAAPTALLLGDLSVDIYSNTEYQYFWMEILSTRTISAKIEKC